MFFIKIIGGTALSRATDFYYNYLIFLTPLLLKIVIKNITNPTTSVTNICELCTKVANVPASSFESPYIATKTGETMAVTVPAPPGEGKIIAKAPETKKVNPAMGGNPENLGMAKKST